MSEELRPCPFCGSTESDEVADNCYLQLTDWIGDKRPPQAEIEKRWNNRPIEDALKARIAELEGENTELKERVAMLDVTAVFKSLGEMGHIEKVTNLKAELDRATARIAELEAEVTRLLTESDDAHMAEARYIAKAELAKRDARIAELEADNKKADECPICGGSGFETIDIVEGCDIKSICSFCKGRGKISLRQLIDYQIHINDPEVQE